MSRGPRITVGLALVLALISGTMAPVIQTSVATAVGLQVAAVHTIRLSVSPSVTIQHRLGVAIAVLTTPRSDGRITFWIGSLAQPVYTCIPARGRCVMPWTAATTSTVIIRARWSGDRYFGAAQTRARVRVRAARFTETGVLGGVSIGPLTRVVPTPHLSSLSGVHPAGRLTSFASRDPQYRCLRGHAIPLYTAPQYPDDLLAIAPAAHGCQGGAWLLPDSPVVRGITPGTGPVGTLVALRGRFPRMRPPTGVATILGASVGAPNGLIERWTSSRVQVAIPPPLGVRVYGLRLDWYDRLTGSFVHAVAIPRFRVTSAVLPPIIPSTTRVLHASDLQHLVVPANHPLDPSAPVLPLTFAAPDAAVRSLRPGDVIATGITPETPLGLLRRVVLVAPGSAPGTLTVQTRQATIAEAIRQGTLDVAPALSQASTLAVVPLAPGVQVTSYAPGAGSGLTPHVLLPTGARDGDAAYPFCDELSLDVLAAFKGKERDGSAEHGTPIDEPADGNGTDPATPSAPMATPQVNATPPPQQTLIAAEKTASAAHLPVSPIPAGGATPAPAATVEHSHGARLEAHVTVCGDMQPRLRIDVAQLWPAPQILTTFHMHARQFGSLRIFGGVYAEFSGQRTLFEHEFAPKVITVGSVPFVIQPTLLFTLGVDGKVSAGFEFKTTETLRMDVGVSCDNGDCHQTAFRHGHTIGHGPLHLTSDNAVDAWVEPGIELRIDGIAIPSTGVRGTVKFEVQPGETPWWKFVGTIGFTVSIRFEVIFAEGQFDLTVQLKEFTWAEARGGKPAEGTLTPPSTSLPTSSPSSGAWIETGSMSIARENPPAPLLLDGKVLVIGGCECTKAELYDPSTGKWATTGSMIVRRDGGFTATRLNDGRVLVAGGATYFSTTANPDIHTKETSAAELYNPRTGTWSLTGPMTTPRASHTATLLLNGKVLVVGGCGHREIVCFNQFASGNEGIPGIGVMNDTTEIYDPGTGKWTSSGPLIAAREFHTATLLPDGKVLVAGGLGRGPSPSPNSAISQTTVLSSTELYDPSTAKWVAAASLQVGKGRFDHTAVALHDGRVLVIGGLSDIAGCPCEVTQSEVYGPTTNTWTSTGALGSFDKSLLQFLRYRGNAVGTATLLRSGHVLVVGGCCPDYANDTNAAELYDPSTGAWAAVPSLPNALADHAAVLLADGQVLVVGGCLGPYPCNSTKRAELYRGRE